MSDDNSQQLQERVFVLRAQLGDAAAFQELVALYEERMAYYVQRLVRDWDQSRDVLQQVWLDVFRKLGKLESPAAFRVWLYRIAHDHAVVFIRRQAKEKETHEAMAADAVDVDSWNELDLLDKAELVHTALNKLSLVHREIMTLRFLEGMEIRDIAQVMETSEGTAKSRLHYAKNALRRIISEECDHA